MKTAEKVALVTGGSRGIGRAVAPRLARDGFAVVINYAGNAAKAAQVVDAIAVAGGHAIAVQGDVSNDEHVAKVFEIARTTFGRIDVVVNSAGIMQNAPITEFALADFDKIIQTNLRGAFNVLRHAAKNLTQGDRIITLSTSVIANAFPTYGPYVASKAGVEALVHVLANELRGRGVTVNAIAPGPVGTELFLNGKSDEQIAQISKLSPLERLGAPEDIANAVSFLAGPDGAWVNSQVLRVNGGMA